MDLKEKIVAGAAKLFFKNGFKSLTMDELASKLGVSKKTVYQFFEDKPALVAAAVAYDVENDQRECAICGVKAGNAIEEVFLVMQMLGEQLADANPFVLQELNKYYPIAAEGFHKHTNEFVFNMIKANLQRGVAEGLYREGINFEVLAKYRLESMLLLFDPDRFPLTKKYPIMQLATMITEVFINGIATQKGQKLILKQQQLKEKL
jgi:TetR/AcrR family transcriptional regulator, cholesterol catabolism regulator